MNLSKEGVLSIKGILLEDPEGPYFSVDNEGNIFAKSFVVKSPNPDKLLSFGKDGVTLYGTLVENNV